MVCIVRWHAIFVWLLTVHNARWALVHLFRTRFTFERFNWQRNWDGVLLEEVQFQAVLCTQPKFHLNFQRMSQELLEFSVHIWRYAENGILCPLLEILKRNCQTTKATYEYLAVLMSSCICSTSMPSNGFAPNINMYAMTPIAQISLRQSNPRRRMTSGAR